jgi:hypothetical protein
MDFGAIFGRRSDQALEGGDRTFSKAYTHFVVISTPRGDKIESGWEYVEDAREHLSDVPAVLSPRVVGRRGLARLKLDPGARGRDWAMAVDLE